MFDGLGFFLVLMILGGLGSAAWWIFVIWMGAKAFRAASAQLDTLLPQIASQIRSYEHLPMSQRANQGTQIAAMLLKAQNQMRQIDALHKARYETRVGEIQSMAAGAGIDFRPDSW